MLSNKKEAMIDACQQLNVKSPGKYADSIKSVPKGSIRAVWLYIHTYDLHNSLMDEITEMESRFLVILVVILCCSFAWWKNWWKCAWDLYYFLPLQISIIFVKVKVNKKNASDTVKSPLIPPQFHSSTTFSRGHSYPEFIANHFHKSFNTCVTYGCIPKQYLALFYIF